jgi:hypothetical protein
MSRTNDPASGLGIFTSEKGIKKALIAESF